MIRTLDDRSDRLPAETLPPSPIGRPHSLLEDAYAIFIGCTLLIVGLVFLKAAGLVTGGIAGVALLLSYLIPLPAGVLFTLVNIPSSCSRIRSWARGSR